MSIYTERITAALAGIQSKFESKDAEILRLQALRDKLQAQLDVTPWAELSNGANIAVGDTVRYLFKFYQCTQAHTKTLLKAPTNAEYWREVEL